MPGTGVVRSIIPKGQQMKIVLMRHGEAFDSSERAERPLTPKGVQDVRRIGRFLKQTGWTWEEVRSSPVQRAMETGRLAAEALGVPHRIDALLEPGLESEEFLESLEGLEASTARLYVFHMPDIAVVAARLLGCQPDRFFFGPASALGINLSPRLPVTGLQVFHYQPDYFDSNI